MILQEAPCQKFWLAKRHGAGPETDKAAGAMAAMLGTIVKNAIERA
jgi:hypothetical protein